MTPRSAAPTRKLHAGHFAFMRAVMQGLDARDSWQRYLSREGEPDHPAYIRKMVNRIRDEFAAAARRHERHGIARLILLDPSRIPEREQRLPSLEEFAAAHDLGDFSEAEQIEHYMARYGDATRRQTRRARLIASQIEALGWLEQRVAATPAPRDLVADWMNHRIASRLAAVGIQTLPQLADHINGKGPRWWVPIPGIGARKAERVVDWMREHERDTGLTIREPQTGAARGGPAPEAEKAEIAPLERLALPDGLDGRAGRNRAPRESLRIDADDDIAAIRTWLARHGSGDGSQQASGHTRRTYRREAERFLIWCAVERGLPMSSAGVDECRAYLHFLARPEPAGRWCAPRATERWSPHWRPFEGPLSPNAVAHAVRILRAGFRYLVDCGYLATNPWDTLAPTTRRPAATGLRTLQPSDWALLLKALAELPPAPARQRATCALLLIRDSGMRLSDLVALRRSDVVREPGARWRIAPSGTLASPGLGEALALYLAGRAGAEAETDDGRRAAPLFGRLHDIAERLPWSVHARSERLPEAGIAAGTLSREIKSLLADCAAAIAAHDPAAAARIRNASADWLRSGSPPRRGPPGDEDLTARRRPD